MDDKDKIEINPNPEIRTCDTEECIASMAALIGARNALIAKCQQISGLFAQKTQLGAIAFRLWVFAMMTLLIGAILLGLSQLPPPLTALAGPATAALVLGAALAAIAAVMGAIILVMEARLNTLRGERNTLRTAFDAAVANVTTNCPPQCWSIVNMTVPC